MWWKVWNERRRVRGEVVMVAAGTKLGPYETIVPIGAGTRSCSAEVCDVGHTSRTAHGRSCAAKLAQKGQGSALAVLAHKPRFSSRCKSLKTQGALLGFEAHQKHMISGQILRNIMALFKIHEFPPPRRSKDL
jgi:hypothetical protein